MVAAFLRAPEKDEVRIILVMGDCLFFSRVLFTLERRSMSFSTAPTYMSGLNFS